MNLKQQGTSVRHQGPPRFAQERHGKPQLFHSLRNLIEHRFQIHICSCIGCGKPAPDIQMRNIHTRSIYNGLCLAQRIAVSPDINTLAADMESQSRFHAPPCHIPKKDNALLNTGTKLGREIVNRARPAGREPNTDCHICAHHLLNLVQLHHMVDHKILKPIDVCRRIKRTTPFDRMVEIADSLGQEFANPRNFGQ